MATYRKILTLMKRNKILHYSRNCKRYSTNVKVKEETSKSDEIVVPYRIHRGPTDILKALASTISKDYTAPQYRYEDDPYFIPASGVTKRAFALSKESGKKAARYFLEKYPELFLSQSWNKSEPYVKAFDPPTVYTEENVTSPDVLLECIEDNNINNSIIVYKILKEKGFVVSQEVKQDLLELLCFYNGIQPPDEDYYEERYFQRKDQIEKWDRKGEAERLFDEMEKDSKAYSALIAGAGKFQDAERAFELYDEMKSKGLSPTLDAYNSLIASVPSVKENRESTYEYTMLLLGTMQREGLVPDLYTMNAVLGNLERRRLRKSKDVALSVLAEMKRLNIEPSLGTYSILLNIFMEDYNNNNIEVGVLYEVIKELEGKELTARHPLDVIFFVNAMEKCFKYVQDKDLAYRINKIVEYRNNCKLLGNNLSENVYFKNFLRTLCEFEDLDKFMEIYEQYVPNTYTPEPALMLNILRNVQLMGSYKYLPKLCNDVYVFEQSERENILSLLLETAGCMKHDKELQEKLVDAVWKIVEKLNMRIEAKRQNFNWVGSDLANALNVFVYGKDLEKSWSVLQQFAKPDTVVIGPPSKESLLNFCELFLETKDYDKVKFCIKYASNEAYPEFMDDFKKLTDNMFKNEQLEERQRVHVNGIIQSFSYEFSDESTKMTHKASSSDSSTDEDLSSDASSDEDLSSDSSPSDQDLSSDSSSSDEEDNK